MSSKHYAKVRCYKIRDLFKVKLYIIRSETKEKRQREKVGEREIKKIEREKKEGEREGDFKYLLTLILTGGHK